MKARDNPFAVERILQIRYRPLSCTWDDLIENLKSLELRAAIVGDHGTGKSTLLDDLRPRIQELGFQTQHLRLNQDEPKFAPGYLATLFERLSANDVILFDGAEQMSWFRWRRFVTKTRRASGLIITTHRPGRLPTLIHCQTTSDLLQQIVVEILGNDAANLTDLVEHLFEKHRGNLREALRDMYDCFANDQLAISDP